MYNYISNTTSKILNYNFPVPGDATTNASINNATGQDKSAEGVRRNLSNYITPVQLQRLKVDINEWRQSVIEAELAYYPHRVRQQRMYLDTELNGHVSSVMDRRKDLTLLRKFQLAKKQGEMWVPSVDLTQQFEEFNWFQDFLGYALDALFYGYSLITMGDVEQSILKNVGIVRRWNVSPDREQVTAYIYSTTGKNWNDDDVKPWHIYIKTPSTSGIGNCGYGLFYKIALYEIFLRNLLGYNGDFIELYAQPYRVGKTSKTSESERAELESALQKMGSNGYAVIDPLDEISFLETALGGTGWKGYENLEQRCQKLISKVVLGHADAMDSVPGKIGASQGEESPVSQALANKQTKDGRFVQPIVNNELIPRLRDLGIFRMPDGYRWMLINDDEAEEMREREDKSNLVTAQIAQTMTSAGLQMSPQYFQERTGIETEAKAVQEPDGDEPNTIPEKIKNMMADLYDK